MWYIILNKHKEVICAITKKSIEGIIKANKDKKNPRIDSVILLWNALDYYDENCENKEEMKEEEPEIESVYIWYMFKMR